MSQPFLYNFVAIIVDTLIVLGKLMEITNPIWWKVSAVHSDGLMAL